MMSHGHRLLSKWARLVHVYLTLFGFVVLLFFAVTGFVLNHEEWFGLDRPIEKTTTGTLPTAILAEPDTLAVVEALRKDFGATGYVAREDFGVDDHELRVVFRTAGGLCEAKVDRTTGEAEVTRESRGVIGLLTDLHRGKTRDKTLGGPWGLLIDAVAGIFVVVAVTGLILWTSLRRRGRYGLLVMALGAAASVVVYYVYVP
jgi:hypothetical protein